MTTPTLPPNLSSTSDPSNGQHLATSQITRPGSHSVAAPVCQCCDGLWSKARDASIKKVTRALVFLTKTVPAICAQVWQAWVEVHRSVQVLVKSVVPGLTAQGFPPDIIIAALTTIIALAFAIAVPISHAREWTSPVRIILPIVNFVIALSSAAQREIIVKIYPDHLRICSTIASLPIVGLALAPLGIFKLPWSADITICFMEVWAIAVDVFTLFRYQQHARQEASELRNRYGPTWPLVMSSNRQ